MCFEPSWGAQPHLFPGRHCAESLPAEVSPFIGRAQEVAAATALLRRRGVRLVTLTGPGGTGKTRLCIEVARILADDFPHGVSFVSLSNVSDPDRVSHAIAAALELKEVAGTPLEEVVIAFLRPRKQLLVLDNFEHVLPAAPVIARLLRAAPGLSVLVTSRSLLHLSGEHDMLVPGMGLATKAAGREGGAPERRYPALRRARAGALAQLRGHRRQHSRRPGALPAPGWASAGHRAGRGPHPARQPTVDPRAPVAVRSASGSRDRASTMPSADSRRCARPSPGVTPCSHRTSVLSFTRWESLPPAPRSRERQPWPASPPTPHWSSSARWWTRASCSGCRIRTSRIAS